MFEKANGGYGVMQIHHLNGKQSRKHIIIVNKGKY